MIVTTNARFVNSALLGLGITTYSLSLVMHALAYSEFSSIDIFGYGRLTRSWPMMVFPYLLLMVSSLVVRSKAIAAVLLVATIPVFYEGFAWLDYGTSLLHADVRFRHSQERLLEFAQIVRFVGGCALLLGAILLLRARRRTA